MNTHYYIKELSNDDKIWGNFRVQEVLHISCNTGTHALPDMSTLALGCCAYISGNALVPVLQLLLGYLSLIKEN